MPTLQKPLQVIPAAMNGEFLRQVLDELDTVRPSMKHERRKFTRHLHRCLRVVLIVPGATGDAAFLVSER